MEYVDIIKQIGPIVGGFGAVCIVFMVMFKRSIKIWLEKDSSCRVTLKSHEKTLQSHNERLSQVEKSIAVLPVISQELGHIRDTLDRVLVAMLNNGKGV